MKGNIGPFMVSLEECDPDTVAKLIKKINVISVLCLTVSFLHVLVEVEILLGKV